MGVLLENLVKRGEAVNVSPQAIPAAAAREVFSKAGGYGEQGHDTAPEQDALGSASGDVSTQDEGEGVDEVNLDATLLDEKVRELVQSAGAKYDFKAARTAGLMKRVDPELLGAAQRLQNNASLVNEVVRRTNLRRARQGKPPIGSASGSA
jgi:hypothetical protein